MEFLITGLHRAAFQNVFTLLKGVLSVYVSILFDPMKNKTNYYSGTFIQGTPLGKEPNVPEWRLNLGFGNQKKCPFPLNRNVPSMEATDT